MKSNIDDKTSVSVREISETLKVKSEIDESVDTVTSRELKNNTDQTDNTDQANNSILQNVDEIPPPEETKRIRRPPQRYGFPSLSMPLNAENRTDPVSVKQALRGPEKDN
ncbi:hypothetical protein EVAR_36758_1 [Eumeta japonica]|uniref:Uncharacterized protein n=1 Tax=Eumeta variegata TaxID=151549 RepID=A0A4C1X1X3_EUMVA|nr:hypothetical protein EVAR_36758_1 [Eumeta japonica]